MSNELKTPGSTLPFDTDLARRNASLAPVSNENAEPGALSALLERDAVEVERHTGQSLIGQLIEDSDICTAELALEHLKELVSDHTCLRGLTSV